LDSVELLVGGFLECDGVSGSGFHGSSECQF
jgi:hypothetical protein